MFLVLSKLLGQLLMPLPLFFAATLGVAVFGCRGRPRRILLALLAFLWLCSADLVVDRLLAAWETGYPALTLAEVPEADAVVVLGGISQRRPVHGLADRVEFEGGVDRLLEGVRLVRAGKAPRLVLSGGTADVFGGSPPESPRLAAWLTANGHLDARHIVVEDRSRSTSENAERTAALAREGGWKRVILVTSALHMRRAERAFRHTGLEVAPYPADYLADVPSFGPADFVPGENALLAVRKLWREVLGLAAYTLTGRL